MEFSEELRNILGPVDKYRGGRYEEIRDAFARLYEHFQKKLLIESLKTPKFPDEALSAINAIAKDLPPEAHRSGFDPGALIGGLQDDIKALADDSELNKKIAELTAIIENQKKAYESLYTQATQESEDYQRHREDSRRLMLGIKLLLGYTHWPSFQDEVGTTNVVDGVLLLLGKRLKADRGEPCKHERLNEEGMCRACGADCRGAHA